MKYPTKKKNIKKGVLTLPPPFMKKCVVIVAHFPSPFNSSIGAPCGLPSPLSIRGPCKREAKVLKDLF